MCVQQYNCGTRTYLLAVSGRATLKNRRWPSLAATPVLSPGIARAAVWVGLGILARSREIGWRSGLAVIFGVYYNRHVCRDPFRHCYYYCTTEEHYVVRIKKTSAVRSRISSKLIFASCVGYLVTRTTGFMWPHQGCYLIVLIEGNKIWQLWNSVSVRTNTKYVAMDMYDTLFILVGNKYYNKRNDRWKIRSTPGHSFNLSNTE